MIFAQQSSSYESTHDTGIPGLVGVFEAQVVDNQGNVVTASSPAGVVETPAGSGIYAITRVAPGTTGQYSVVGSTDGTYDPGTVSVEDLIVTASQGVPLEPLPPLGQDGAPAMGPCSAWTTGEAVAECCNAEDVGTDFDAYDESIGIASEVLFEKSGHRFAGSCQQTARPCSVRGGLCGIQTLSRGYVVRWADGRWEDAPSCGCDAVSKVSLSGYPVREIVQVKIDGDAVDPADYELQQYRDLVRVDGGSWPSCQAIDRPDTEDGTFSVTYTYGLDPPRTGQRAARDLACQIFRACNPAAPGTGECTLPPGVVRVTRQGVTFDRQTFGALLYDKRAKRWMTGIPSVDLFLDAYNPAGLRRRPSITSPGSPRYAKVL